MAMSEALNRTYREDGIVVVPGAIPPHVIDAALHRLDDFATANRRWLARRGLLMNGMLFRITNLHLVIPELRALFFGATTDALELVDESARASLYTSLYFERGSEQQVHRDTPYFCTSPPYAYAGMWVALDDADEGNGALVAVPGSHLLGEPDIEDLRRRRFGDAPCPSSDSALFDSYNAAVLDLARSRGLEPRLYPARRGDVVVWNASTLHGGHAHSDAARTRRSLVMHVTPKGVPVAGMDHFFHPQKAHPERAPWSYIEDGGRDFADFGQVSFMHRLDVPVNQFGLDFALPS